jgi:hypothetical protein
MFSRAGPNADGALAICLPSNGDVPVPSRPRSVVGAANAGFFFNSVTVTTPPYSRYSIHDCADPRFAELSNCIWPIGNPGPNGLSVKNGIMIYTPDDAAAGDGPLVVTVAYS